MNAITRTLAALTAALLLAACASPQTPTVAPPTATPTPVITPEPTGAVTVTTEDLPTIYRTLSEKLNIPLDDLRAMTDAQITALVEQNAAALGLTVYEAETGAPLDADAAQSPAALCAAVQRAVGFLASQYNPPLRLLRESPVTAPDKHWLATDNALALAALRAAAPCAPDAAKLAADIEQGLAAYEAAPHGLIEAAGGGPVTWPPRTANQMEVAPGVWREERTSGGAMDDWREYADLALIGVIYLAQQGQTDDARALFGETLALFDGAGFADKANGNGQPYAAYKLALAILAADAVGAPPDASLVAALLGRQDRASGGFYALYDAGGGLNDANTETTAYSILALMALGAAGDADAAGDLPTASAAP